MLSGHLIRKIAPFLSHPGSKSPTTFVLGSPITEAKTTPLSTIISKEESVLPAQGWLAWEIFAFLPHWMIIKTQVWITEIPRGIWSSQWLQISIRDTEPLDIALTSSDARASLFSIPSTPLHSVHFNKSTGPKRSPQGTKCNLFDRGQKFQQEKERRLSFKVWFCCLFLPLHWCCKTEPALLQEIGERTQGSRKSKEGETGRFVLARFGNGAIKENLEALVQFIPVQSTWERLRLVS